MGVDFYAKLFVGVEEQDFDWEGAGLESGSLEIVADRYWGHKSIPGGLHLEYLRPDNWTYGLIGFTVANSGSYGYREAETPEAMISLARLTFSQLFFQHARVFVCAEVG